MSAAELRHRASAAAHAHRSYNDGRLGYYVVNERTDIAIAGPYKDEHQAQRVADERNAEPPTAPDKLRVMQIARSR